MCFVAIRNEGCGFYTESVDSGADSAEEKLSGSSSVLVTFPFSAILLSFSIALCLEEQTMKTVEHTTKLPLAKVGNSICPDLLERWSANHRIKSRFSRSKVLLADNPVSASTVTVTMQLQ